MDRVRRGVWSAVRGRPGSRSWRSWGFDVLVAAAWAGVLVPDLIDGVESGRGGLVIGLAVIAVAALVVRRRWPWPVLMVLLALVVGKSLAGLDLGLGFLAFVGLYTVIVWSDPHAAATRTTTVVAAGLTVLVEAINTRAWAGSDEFDDFLLTLAVVIAISCLALYRSARRAAVHQLRERAELLTQRAALLEREQEQQRQLAVSQERVRIAAEMHDVVGHHLTVMVTLAEGTLRALPMDGPTAEPIRLIADTGREALTETRRILGVLRTAPGADARPDGPVPAVKRLHALVEPVRAAGVLVELVGLPEWAGLPEGLADELLKVVAEALTNVLKHAGPGTATRVRLSRQDAEVELTVIDDGAGAPTAAAVSSGAGLVGMGTRLAPWAGRVTAGPRSEGGWRLQVDATQVPARNATSADPRVGAG